MLGAKGNKSYRVLIFITNSVVAGGIVELCLLYPAVKSF